MSNFKLNNGLTIPNIGFGTWKLRENIEQVIHWALEVGYTHIDTAAIYGNEKEIGDAIKSFGVQREKLFLTTKIWASERGYEKTKQAIETSLQNLGTDYIDLMLIHWPAKTSQEKDRKSTRLNSSHVKISYAVFCLKKKTKKFKT